MKLTRNIQLIAYIVFMALTSYLAMGKTIIIYAMYLGMTVLIFHPALPLTEEYTGEFTLIPQMISLSYFIAMGVIATIMFRKKRIKKTAVTK